MARKIEIIAFSLKCFFVLFRWIELELFMNIALWIYLFLYNIYLACCGLGIMSSHIIAPIPLELNLFIVDGFLLLSAIVIFSLRPFIVSKLRDLVLLLTSSLVASGIVMQLDAKGASLVVTSLLVLFSIILIPIAIYKRQNALIQKCWMIMPASVLVAILLWIVHVKFPQLMDYYFYYTLGMGCVISFSYSLVQNVIHIIRKVLKE